VSLPVTYYDAAQSDLWTKQLGHASWSVASPKSKLEPPSRAALGPRLTMSVRRRRPRASPHRNAPEVLVRIMTRDIVEIELSGLTIRLICDRTILTMNYGA
jgi:hypothetical protein